MGDPWTASLSLPLSEDPMLVCVAEDRPTEVPGIKLLLLTLERHLPGVPVVLTFPPADAELKRWLRRFPHVQLQTEPLPGAHGWNVKPQALLQLLEEGAEELVWIDSDIILTDDFRPLLADLDERTLVCTEETYWGQHQGGVHRAESWGLVPARPMPVSVNTGFLRVTQAHRALLEAWRIRLEDPTYRQVQARPWSERPAHMLGDQDVLSALLSSADFADVPVAFLHRGEDIAQCFGPAGFTVGERLSCGLRGMPPLVHAMGRKPWHYAATPDPRSDLRGWYDALGVELSPYVAVARRYVDELDEDLDWYRRRSAPGLLLDVLSAGHPALRGLAQAAADGLVRRSKAGLGLDRIALRSDERPSA